MRRDASREGLQRFRTAQRNPPGQVRTLAQLQRSALGKWCWVYRAAYGCLNYAPVAIAPLIIRWGPEASSDMLRRSARCTKCGAKGATLMLPSWVSTTAGFAPFPVSFVRALQE
jgi:hypothetical protein